MKIRTGFISNSSTSSFIVKGYVIPQEQLKDIDIIDFSKTICPEVLEKDWIKKCIQDKNFDTNDIRYEIEGAISDFGIYFTDSEEQGAPENSYIIGELLQDTGSDDYIEDQVIDCEPTERLNKISNYLKDFGVAETKIKVIIGTRLC